MVRHLSAAADLLAAGRDLLHTHFTGPPSAQTARSDWAAVILSWPVTSALISEVAACARRLAPWAAQLPVTGPDEPGGSAAAAGLRTGSRWLWRAGAAVYGAQEDPPSAEAMQLLAAVPLNVPPAAQPRSQPELVPQLCDGITITAERLRHATRAFAATARWAPEATSVSWRRDALASAITTHSSVFILRMLTQRARQLGLDAAIQAQLRTAAMAMNTVWPAWYKVAREWDIITTGRHPPGSLTPVAAEIGELALRTGRLARRDPHWTPARTGLGLIRDPATLAPARGDVPAVSPPFTTLPTPSRASPPKTGWLSARRLSTGGSTFPPACCPPETRSRTSTRPSAGHAPGGSSPPTPPSSRQPPAPSAPSTTSPPP